MSLPSFPQAWWIDAGRVLGGSFPGDLDPARADAKLTALADAGVTRVVCLQEAGERGAGGRPFPDYVPRLTELVAARGRTLRWLRVPIPDMGVPTEAAVRSAVQFVAEGDGVAFVHCWGGHGRTGTFAGVWLRERGLSAEAAFAAIAAARRHDGKLAAMPSPQTDAQRRFVREWAPADPRRDRLRGALLGAAVGDALGTTLEFTRPPAASWATPLAGPHHDVVGGGPFAVAAGQVTDDTQMAACLAATLAEHGHSPPSPAALAALGDRYRAWVARAFDAGNQTRSALAALRAHPPTRAGFVAWEAAGGKAAGNGALMRAAPLATLGAPAVRRAWALADAALTHADPRCLLANVAFADALAAGVAGADAAGMVEAARAGLDAARAAAPDAVPLPAGDPRWAAAHAELSLDLDAAERADPWLDGQAAPPAGWPPLAPGLAGGLHLAGAMQGFVRVAFRLAFWQLRHAADWRGALVDTVNRGGDADTNGAIVGALLGARFGAAAIPAAWRQRVLDADPPEPWGSTGAWHPRRLLDAPGL